MSLLEKLQKMKKTVAAGRLAALSEMERQRNFVDEADRSLEEIDTAIAALSPTNWIPQPAPTPQGGEVGGALSSDQFLIRLIRDGGTWHDGGPNPAPGQFMDIYVPARSTSLGDQPQYLEGQPSDAYIWQGWEVAYRVVSQPAQTDAASDATPAADTPRTLINDPLADPDLSSSDPLVSETGEGLEPDAELELTERVDPPATTFPTIAQSVEQHAPQPSDYWGEADLVIFGKAKEPV